jgi:hypothetical protein
MILFAVPFAAHAVEHVHSGPVVPIGWVLTDGLICSAGYNELGKVYPRNKPSADVYALPDTKRIVGELKVGRKYSSLMWSIDAPDFEVALVVRWDWPEIPLRKSQ